MAPAIEVGQNVPAGRVFRNDQTNHTFHFLHYLNTLKTDPVIEENYWVNYKSVASFT